MKRLLRIGVATVILPLAVSACTVDDIATARQLTIEDGARFVNENHERRRDVRQAMYGIEDTVIDKCEDKARGIDITQDMESALQELEGCFDFLERSYPDLATIQALREAREQFNKLRDEAP